MFPTRLFGAISVLQFCLKRKILCLHLAPARLLELDRELLADLVVHNCVYHLFTVCVVCIMIVRGFPWVSTSGLISIQCRWTNPCALSGWCMHSSRRSCQRDPISRHRGTPRDRCTPESPEWVLSHFVVLVHTAAHVCHRLSITAPPQVCFTSVIYNYFVFYPFIMRCFCAVTYTIFIALIVTTSKPFEYVWMTSGTTYCTYA